jgi:thiol-disulfide isomerase/thioredoxin
VSLIDAPFPPPEFENDMNSLKHLFALAVTVFLCFCPTDLLSGTTPLTTPISAFGRPDSLKVGDLAPMFVLRDLSSGDAVYLRDYTGKNLRDKSLMKERQVVILSFWATWCQPCKHEIPLLTKLAEKYKDKPVKVFLVNTLETTNEPTHTEDSIKTAYKDRGYSLQCLIDATGRTGDQYKVRSLPVIVVIDKYGVIRKVSKALQADYELELSGLLNTLIKE